MVHSRSENPKTSRTKVCTIYDKHVFITKINILSPKNNPLKTFYKYYMGNIDQLFFKYCIENSS